MLLSWKDYFGNIYTAMSWVGKTWLNIKTPSGRILQADPDMVDQLEKCLGVEIPGKYKKFRIEDVE